MNFDLQLGLDNGPGNDPIVISKNGFSAANMGDVLSQLSSAFANWPPILPELVQVQVKKSDVQPNAAPHLNKPVPAKPIR